MSIDLTPKEKPYVCEYCKKSYAREKTLVTHLCEPKRRWLQKEEKHVVYAFYAFQRFYKLSTGVKKEKNYEDFVNSTFYNSFVKFGSFINNVRPLYPEKYIDSVVTSNIKLDNWCSEALYEQYALNLILNEDASVALERSVNSMIDWAKEPKIQKNWNDYFRHVSSTRAVWDIKDGKISPWLLLNCASGQNMLQNFTDEQLNLVHRVIDPRHWSVKFKRYQGDLKLVKDVVSSSGL